MNGEHAEVGVVDRPRPGGSPVGGVARTLVRVVPLALALGCAAGVAVVGLRTGWSLPKFSALRGEAAREPDDWCVEHTVPESACVECNPDLLPAGRRYGWCRRHGVHDCPLDHPDVAQVSGRPGVTAADRERADRALAFAPRDENNSKCRLHERRIQLASPELAARLGLEVVPATRAAVAEWVTAPGEIGYDPTRVARLSARVPGTVWRVEKRVGDPVRRGEVLAVIDAAEVGRAKAEFQQAVVQLDLRRQAVAAAGTAPGAVPGRAVAEAEAAVEEARVRLLTAEQALANLGLPVPAADVRTLPPADLARRVQFLGLPEALARDLAGKTASNNLIPVTAPLDGVVVARSAAPGEAADPRAVLFVVADTSRLRLTLRVRVEDADRLAPGRPVRFRHEGHDGWDEGTVVWVSPAADPKTRTVPVRVDLPNPDGRHHAHSFGTARVILRDEPAAVVVPSDAVHWEGCCHVVFVRDRRSGSTGAPEVFHVRKVRPGAQDVVTGRPVTEVIAGLLPGERVAAGNSGVLRSELLKNSLGEC